MLRPTAVAALLMVAAFGLAEAQPPGRRADSPAASPVPASATEQTFAPALIERGKGLFGAQCAFCHGLDAAGGSGGPDLTRSTVVAEDVGGDKIGAVVRAGRPNGQVPMPAFADLSAADLGAIVAFVHDQKSRAESAEGGRRSVSLEDLQTGDARAGQRYFDANCTACHSADGDLAGIATRMNGLRLLQRMLYPRGGGRGDSPDATTPTVIVTTPDGARYRGKLAYEDEFTIALTDAAGRYRSFSTRLVDFAIENPLQGHLDWLERLTDKDMHDVLAYLHTLR
jgi:cytochrome c oxidase cbb3-type subunit III